MYWQGQPAVLTVLWETTAIEEASLAAQKNAERSRVLADLSQAFAEAGLNREIVLQTIVQQLAVTSVDACIIRLLSDDGEWLVPVAFHSSHSEIHLALANIYENLKEKPDAGMAGKVFTTGKTIRASNPKPKELKSIMGPRYRSILNQFSVNDMYYLPLKASGKIFGVLGMVRFTPGQEYSKSDLDFLKEVSDRAALAIDNARLYAQEAQRAIELEALHREVQRLAHTDTLTNSYNRRGFFEMGERELERFHRFGHPLSAMMLDIDGFKSLNDTYGHSFGDQVLQTLASVCQRTIRQIDIIGRYGGDEFGILLPESDLDRAGKLADRLHRVLTSTVVDSPDGPIHLAISIGVAEAFPETKDLSELLARADAALYEAKNNGRNQVKRA
jgi:diguanylate cyclase (GGDEF)-like protein